MSKRNAKTLCAFPSKSFFHLLFFSKIYNYLTIFPVIVFINHCQTCAHFFSIGNVAHLRDMQNYNIYGFIAFACNAKSSTFACAVFFFISFPFSSLFLDDRSNVFFVNFTRFINQEACYQDRFWFIKHTKKIFLKSCSLSCYSRCMWHMTGHVL